jgi:hypothetical protein
LKFLVLSPPPLADCASLPPMSAEEEVDPLDAYLASLSSLAPAPPQQRGELCEQGERFEGAYAAPSKRARLGAGSSSAAEVLLREEEEEGQRQQQQPEPAEPEGASDEAGRSRLRSALQPCSSAAGLPPIHRCLYRAPAELAGLSSAEAAALRQALCLTAEPPPPPPPPPQGPASQLPSPPLLSWASVQPCCMP